MLSTRNVRLIVPLIALITVVALVISSSYSPISTSVQKVKEKAADAVPFSTDEEDKNTLQGKPHVGTEAPYAAGKPLSGGSSSGGSGKYKADTGLKGGVVADTSNSEKSSAQKLSLEGAGSDSALKPPKGTANKGLGNEKYGDSGSVAKGKTNGACNSRDFVVMIDAGSTGSRVHVYEFDSCVSPPALIQETFKMNKPGLSSFDTDTVGAAHSLDELLEEAVNTVPKDKQGCTPVAVKATAGLRLLGEEKAANILKEVRSHLEKDYPFAVVEGDGISMMDGADEGVYAWVTANYLLGNIGGAEKTPTAAVFDLGGGSTQIVFEPQFSSGETMADGDHNYQISFGNRDYTLYQYSHLGYGLMQGRNKVHGVVVESALKSGTKLKKYTKKDELKDQKASVTLNNACIAPGVVAENVQVELAKDEFYLVNMKGPEADSSIHAGANCRFLAEKVLNKDIECSESPCSFNGIYQPSLTKSFNALNDMYVFSYFYDTTNPLGFPSSFTVGELSELAKVVCGGEAFWGSVLLDDGVGKLNKEPQWCLDLSFITAMLHTGYDIPLHRELRTAKTINNNELGWCLGASLPLLEKSSGWKCRISEVN